MKKYDVVIIGSGPGGYVAAIRCAQLGMKTALVEKYAAFGGTCLNVGCIPSKALLDSTEHFRQASIHFKTHGIEVKGLKANWAQMMARKNEVVKISSAGIKFLLKKNKVDTYEGQATFVNKKLIEITPQGKEKEQIETDKTIIATGSKPSSLPGITIDKKRIITSTEALNLPAIPSHLIVIGGGAIGLELGSVCARLGSKVSVLEFTDSIIGTMDRSLGKELQKILSKSGFEFYLGHKVTSVSVKGKEVSVFAENNSGETIELKGDYCLVSVGRKPYTEGLGLDKTGIECNEKGRIVVNENLETSTEGIYAIGDVIKGPMLAHKAEEEGVFVAEIMVGQKPHINYNLIPAVVYTWPEVAGIGSTEEALKAKNIKYKTGSFPFRASGRARASMDTDGFVKVLADESTDEILGVHIIGPRAADLIGEAVVAMEFRSSAEDLSRMSHAHPAFSEAIKEACLDATGKRAIHI